MAKGKKVTLFINGKRVGEMRHAGQVFEKKYSVHPMLVFLCSRYTSKLHINNSTLFN